MQGPGNLDTTALPSQLQPHPRHPVLSRDYWESLLKMAKPALRPDFASILLLTDINTSGNRLKPALEIPQGHR